MTAKMLARFAPKSNHAKGVAYGILSALSVSGYVLVNRYVYNQYEVRPLSYAVTFAAAAGLFGALGLLFRHLQKRDIIVTRQSSWQLLVIGLAGGLAMALVATGQNYTTAVNAGIVMTASIITTSIFSALLLKDRFSSVQRLWLAVMFVGLYLGVVGLHILSFRIGDLVILVAMTVLGFNNTFSKIVMRKLDGVFVADARLAISALLMLGVGVGVLGFDVLVTNAGLWPLLAGLFLWLCIRTFYKAVQYASPNQAIVLNNSQIFFTALAGVVLLSEPYDWVKFAGSILVLLSVYFISRK